MIKLNKFIPSQNHWTIRPMQFGGKWEQYRERVNKDQLKYLLLHGSEPIIRGHVRNWKHKHLGVGVYELWVDYGKDPS